MKRTLSLTAAALILLFAGYVGGRYTTPTKIVEKEKRVEVVKEIRAKTSEIASASIARGSESSRQLVTYRTRYIQRPDGTVESSTEAESRAEDAKARDVSVSASERKAEIRYVDRLVTVEKIKEVEAARPRWSIGAFGGLDMGARQVYGGRAEVRVLGPLWVGVQADSRGAGMISARVEF